MKRSKLTMLFSTIVATCSVLPLALAQVEKLPRMDPSQVRQLSHANAIRQLHQGFAKPATRSLGAPTLATWSYSIIAYDGNQYTGQIVGRSPFLRGKITTTVPVVLIPLKITISQNGSSFIGDPLGPDPGCLGAGNTAVGLTQQSPLFNPANISMGGDTPTPTFVGNTTYPDAHLRASFWSAIGATASSAYHLALSVSTAPEQSLSFRGPTSTAVEYGLGGTQCGTNSSGSNIAATLGVVNINAIDPALRTIITNLGITEDQFPFFVLYYEVMSDGDATNLNNCCILGYHDAEGSPGQTYGIAEYDTGTVFGGVADITGMSHEVEEWIFDPTGVNLTPPWGNIGQQPNCQNNLEVGDPLSGTQFPGITMPNSVTYHPQELAYFWWFFTPVSGGVNGVFSNNGTFLGNAKACPPGGTN